MKTTPTRLDPLPAALRRAGLGALFACALAAAVLPAGAASAPGAPFTLANVEVSYRDPAQFTELQRFPNERREWLDELSRYTANRAARVLPAGERLSITITEVQLAGTLEPWRRAILSDVRIVRDSTPPRIDLTFRLESSQGMALKQGERQLRDINFLARNARFQDRALAYEKNLIDDWLRREFGTGAP